jgi:hypothetical protein
MRRVVSWAVVVAARVSGAPALAAPEKGEVVQTDTLGLTPLAGVSVRRW